MTQPKDKQSQIDKFKEAARELGTNEDEGAFDETVRKVAKNPPRTESREKGNGEEK